MKLTTRIHIGITKAQQQALLKKWHQANQGLSFLAFRRTVEPALYDNVIMVRWSGMWLGIETDGYTHS